MHQWMLIWTRTCNRYLKSWHKLLWAVSCAGPLPSSWWQPCQQSQSSHRPAETRFVISHSLLFSVQQHANIPSCHFWCLLGTFVITPSVLSNLFTRLLFHYNDCTVYTPHLVSSFTSQTCLFTFQTKYNCPIFASGEVDWCIQLRPSKFSRRTLWTH